MVEKFSIIMYTVSIWYYYNFFCSHYFITETFEGKSLWTHRASAYFNEIYYNAFSNTCCFLNRCTNYRTDSYRIYKLIMILVRPETQSRTLRLCGFFHTCFRWKLTLNTYVNLGILMLSENTNFGLINQFSSCCR